MTGLVGAPLQKLGGNPRQSTYVTARSSNPGQSQTGMATKIQQNASYESQLNSALMFI